MIFLALQWVALTGCSESLASLQGFAGPLMGIFSGVAGMSSFDEYDTSDANFARSEQGWGQVAGGLQSAGQQLQRREAASANLENLPGEVDELYGRRDGIEQDIRTREERLEALGDDKSDAAKAERERLQAELTNLRGTRSNIDSEIRSRERLMEQSGGVLGRDVVTESERREDARRRRNAEETARLTSNPNDTWQDYYTPVQQQDTSGGRRMSRETARQLGNNAQMAAQMYGQYSGS